MAGEGAGRDGEDGPPLVPDGADDRADHNLAASGQEGDGAGGGGPAACGADLAAPLPGVELDRGGGGQAGQAGGDGVDPPRPQQAPDGQPGRDRDRGDEQPGAQDGPGGQQPPRVPVVLHRGQRDGLPGVQAYGLADRIHGGHGQRPGGGPPQPGRWPPAQPRGQVSRSRRQWLTARRPPQRRRRSASRSALKPLRSSHRAAVSRSQDQMLTRWPLVAGRGPRSGAASVRAAR